MKDTFTQKNGPATADTREVTKKKIALAMRLAELTPLKETLEQQKSRLTEEGSKEPAKVLQIIGMELVLQTDLREVQKDIIREQIKLYSLDELQAMVDFYSTPMGQSLFQKQQIMTNIIMEIMQNHMKQLIEDPFMKTRLEARVYEMLGPG